MKPRRPRRPQRPTRAIPTDQGVASRSQRDAFVESWWAERWVAALERLITPLRLARVTIGLAPLSDAAWERVIAVLARRPDLAASLLAGEMPRGIDEAFAQARASLFPTAPGHLRLHCSYPDKVGVCKHIVATCYLLGEQLDEDPFLLFRLRGRGQDELLEGLRRRVGAGSGADAGAGTAATSAVADHEPTPAADSTPLDPPASGPRPSRRPASTSPASGPPYRCCAGWAPSRRWTTTSSRT